MTTAAGFITLTISMNKFVDLLVLWNGQLSAPIVNTNTVKFCDLS